ncbi:hypothetical protein ACFLTS_00710 [Chloroflexota bacterium]
MMGWITSKSYSIWLGNGDCIRDQEGDNQVGLWELKTGLANIRV